MRVHVRLEAAARVDRLTVGVEGALDSIAERLARAVMGRADQQAWKCGRESVYVWRGKDRDNSLAQFFAVWSPTAARLVGGEYDGDEISVRREEALLGYPAERITLPYRAAPAWDETQPRVTQHPAYRRDGIHPIDDVWIYVHVVD